jgi:threonine synthase
MRSVKGLKCKECGLEYKAEANHVCEFCFGPLEVVYDYKVIANLVNRSKIEAGPKSIWRYKSLLPVEGGEVYDLGTGFTPLIKAVRLGKTLNLSNLYIKNDTVNPTYSFKDRVVAVALAKALEFGFDTLACASTGNLANSVAAHAARAGLKSYIFIPASLEKAKILTTAIYGAKVVAVEGNYDDVNRLCAEIASEYKWAFVNVNLRPYYAEGSKTLAFEVAEQLGWRAPDHVVVPVASGSLLTKIHKGLEELKKLGLIEDKPTRVSGAQASGCAPVAKAFKEKSFEILPVKPQTIAKSLAIGNPADGYYALKTVCDTNGYIEDVSDEEIAAGISLLAETEGIFTETAGGVTIAALKKLVELGRVKREELVVVFITGIGLKTLDAINSQVQEPIIIEPNLAVFSKKVLGKG